MPQMQNRTFLLQFEVDCQEMFPIIEYQCGARQNAKASLQGDFEPSGLLIWIAMVCSFVSLCTQMLSRAGVSRVSRGIALDWIVEMQTRPPALPGLFRWIATDCFCVSLCTKMLNSCHPSQQMDCHGLSWCRAKLLYTDTQPIKMYSPGFQKRAKILSNVQIQSLDCPGVGISI